MARTALQFDDETIQALFGHEAAEDEDKARLKEYYFKSDTYRRIRADLPLRILVGHKGIGKSALFTVAMQEDEDVGVLPLLIRPDDVVEIDTKDDDLLVAIRNWKEGLVRIVYEKALTSLGVPAERPAELPHVAGKVVHFVVDLLQPVLKRYVDLSTAQHGAIKCLMQKKTICVYLDDLDRGWSAQRSEIARLSALLSALRDLAREYQGISFRVAFRSDVYFLVRTSDESTDKIEGSVVWQKWSNHEILAMLIKRTESFFGRPKEEADLLAMRQKDLARLLDPLMEPRFQGYGHWQNCPIHRVLMSLIRKRPRDIVKLCTLAALRASQDGRSCIVTADWDGSFSEYSQARLQDTVNEFRSELPGIEKLLLGMKPSKKEKQAKLGYTYTTDALLRKIKNIQEQCSFRFHSGKAVTPKSLAQFMYKINFLTARKRRSDNEIVRFYFEESRYLASELADFGFDWEIHPAYRWALQPDDLQSIYLSLIHI